jgi:hypothetical protein
VQTTLNKQRITEDSEVLGEHPSPALYVSPMQSVDTASAGLIDETIRIRDRHQFEIKLHYPTSRESAAAAYDLECYIFVPHGLGMNRTNYSKARFYDDLQTHIRFKIPSVPLAAIVSGQDSPLDKLEASAAPLLENKKRANVGSFEYRLKLFCCILQSSLRDFIAIIGDNTDVDDRRRLVQQYLDATAEILAAYRSLRSTIFLSAVPRRACDIYAFGDEYISLLVERNSYDLLELLRKANASVLPTSQRKIMELITHELRYRESKRYPSIPTDENDNEQLIFRRNVLKKYMHNVLFLDTRTQREGKVIEHGLFGVAAGISMLFATIVLFLSQSIYGPLTLPVFLALVVGYMFKDRIKEMLRKYFSRKVSSMLFDHKTRIYSNPHQPIGHCRESFDFVDEAKLTDRIIEIRDRAHIAEIESDWASEDVLRYRKRIKLSCRAISAAYFDIDTKGITDIIRFNVAEFTRRMGNSSKELFVMGHDDYRRVKAERVYHLNMVLRYGGDDSVRYKHFRIILNRRKIKRIETVSVEDG